MAKRSKIAAKKMRQIKGKISGTRKPKSVMKKKAKTTEIFFRRRAALRSILSRCTFTFWIAISSSLEQTARL